MGEKLDQNIKGQSNRPNRTKKMGGNSQMKKLQNVFSVLKGVFLDSEQPTKCPIQWMENIYIETYQEIQNTENKEKI